MGVKGGGGGCEGGKGWVYEGGGSGCVRGEGWV